MASLPGKIESSRFAIEGDYCEITNNSTWWNGPEFLLQPETEWPEVITPNSNDMVLQEAVKNPPKITHSLVSVSVHNPFAKVNQIVDVVT